MLSNPDFTGSITELCQKIGVARSTLYRWQSDSVFCKYVDDMIDRYTESELSNVWKALIRRATQGNTEAIKIYFELKNKYKQHIELSGDVVVFSGENELAE